MLIIYMSAVLTLHPTHDASLSNPEWDCDQPEQQQEMNWCAAQEFAAADLALNKQWSVTSAKMKERDEQWNDGHNLYGDKRAGYFDTLLQGQRAWLTFRAEHCLLEGFSARGGSLEPLLVSTCKTTLTEERTKQLKDLADSPA